MEVFFPSSESFTGVLYAIARFIYTLGLFFHFFSISEYWPILYKHNTLYFFFSLFPSLPFSFSLSCLLSPAILPPIGEMEAPAIASLCFDLLTDAQLFANRFNNSAVD